MVKESAKTFKSNMAAKRCVVATMVLQYKMMGI